MEVDNSRSGVALLITTALLNTFKKADWRVAAENIVAHAFASVGNTSARVNRPFSTY